MKILKRISKLILMGIGMFTVIPEFFIIAPIYHVITGKAIEQLLFLWAKNWEVEK